jgi:hypothetical protein
MTRCSVPRGRTYSRSQIEQIVKSGNPFVQVEIGYQDPGAPFERLAKIAFLQYDQHREFTLSSMPFHVRSEQPQTASNNGECCCSFVPPVPTLQGFPRRWETPLHDICCENSKISGARTQAVLTNLFQVGPWREQPIVPNYAGS